MKKFNFLLNGFLIPFIAVLLFYSHSQAGIPCDVLEERIRASIYNSSTSYYLATMNIHYYETASAAAAARAADCGSSMPTKTFYYDGDQYTYYFCANSSWYTYNPTVLNVDAEIYLYARGELTCDLPDTDGDGINDDQDIYPDDPTPYSIKLIGFQTDDGTYDGEHVREAYVTDRGDYFSIGEEYNDTKSEFLVFDGTWIDGADITDSVNLDDINIIGSSTQPEYTTGSTTGDAPDSGDTQISSGIETDGATDQTLLTQRMNDNLSNIADNQGRQTDYLKDINRTLQNLDRNIASNSVDSTQEEIRELEQEAEVTAAEGAFNSVDVDSHYSGISGELTEGTDYDSPGDLEDESFFTSFFSSNPLITAFNNSGFSSSDSVCSISLDLGYLGSHDLSLCEFQSGFAAFGNLLFAFCSLGSLIMIVRG